MVLTVNKHEPHHINNYSLLIHCLRHRFKTNRKIMIWDFKPGFIFDWTLF